jgi:hypothetical protein
MSTSDSFLSLKKPPLTMYNNATTYAQRRVPLSLRNRLKVELQRLAKLQIYHTSDGTYTFGVNLRSGTAR